MNKVPDTFLPIIGDNSQNLPSHRKKRLCAELSMIGLYGPLSNEWNGPSHSGQSSLQRPSSAPVWTRRHIR
jgi:hypothetical protein